MIDDAKVNEFKDAQVRAVTIVGGGFAAVGVAFVILGLFLKRFPVPIAIGSLILYLGWTAVNVYFAHDAESLTRGVIFRIITIVALIKAIQAAIAYEHDRRAAEIKAAVAAEYPQ